MRAHYSIHEISLHAKEVSDLPKTIIHGLLGFSGLPKENHAAFTKDAKAVFESKTVSRELKAILANCISASIKHVDSESLKPIHEAVVSVARKLRQPKLLEALQNEELIAAAHEFDSKHSPTKLTPRQKAFFELVKNHPDPIAVLSDEVNRDSLHDSTRPINGSFAVLRKLLPKTRVNEFARVALKKAQSLHQHTNSILNALAHPDQAPLKMRYVNFQETRWHALRALGEAKYEPAKEEFVEYLGSKDESEKAISAVGLAKIGAVDAIPLIEKELEKAGGIDEENRESLKLAIEQLKAIQTGANIRQHDSTLDEILAAIIKRPTHSDSTKALNRLLYFDNVRYHELRERVKGKDATALDKAYEHRFK